MNVAFYGVELIYILAIGAWIFWTAIGALVGKRVRSPSDNVIKCLFLGFSILLLIEIAGIRGMRLLLGAIPGTYLVIEKQIISIILILLPFGIILGMLFQLTARRYIAIKKTLAIAYAVESAGGFAGGLAGTLFLIAGLQNFTSGVLCSLISLIPLFFKAEEKKDPLPPFGWMRGGWEYCGLCFLIMLISILLFSQQIDFSMTQWNHPYLIDSRDSPYSRITIEGQRGQFVIFENDFLEFETESTDAEAFVHMAAISHPNPQSVLISGGGIEGIIYEILKHHPRQVDYVELNPVLLDMALKHLPQQYKNAIEAVSVFHSDYSMFLKKADTYDLILSGITEPSSGLSNRFFTMEYFRQCSEHLNPGGIFSFCLKSSENIWTSVMAHRNAAIYRALTSVFQDVMVLPGNANILIASNSKLVREPAVLIERFTSKNISTKFVIPAYIRYMLTNDRFFEIADSLDSVHTHPNTDIQPVCYRYSVMIWLSKFIPEMIGRGVIPDSVSIIIWFSILILIVGAVIIGRRRRTWKKIVLTGIAGFIGMTAETIIILYYQVKNGVLFQNIGILLMVFMAGLTAGSAFIEKYRQHQDISRYLIIGFSIINLIFIVVLKLNYPSGIVIISAFMFIIGFIVSGIFGFVSTVNAPYPNELISPLYAADLFGGCFGSVIGSLVLIPFIGMQETAALMALSAPMALLLVES